MQVQPYICFEGRCEEALDFYKKALGAEVGMLMRFKDQPGGADGCAGGPAPDPDKVMHAELRIGQSELLVSDGMSSGKPGFAGISLALQPRDAAEAERLFQALSEGGQVQMPLGPTFFSAAFGMVADRFGVPWMVAAPPAQ